MEDGLDNKKVIKITIFKTYNKQVYMLVKRSKNKKNLQNDGKNANYNGFAYRIIKEKGYFCLYFSISKK